MYIRTYILKILQKKNNLKQKQFFVTSQKKLAVRTKSLDLNYHEIRFDWDRDSIQRWRM